MHVAVCITGAAGSAAARFHQCDNSPLMVSFSVKFELYFSLSTQRDNKRMAHIQNHAHSLDIIE